MKFIILLIVLLSGSFAECSFGQSAAQPQGNAALLRIQSRNVSTMAVRLITSVASQQYCTKAIDSQTGDPQLRLRLKLRVTNVSQEGLIIPRYGAATFGVVLSESLRDAEAQHYAYDSYSVLRKFRLAEPDFPMVAPPKEFFAVLKPDEYYDYEYSQQIDISLTDPGNQEWGLRSGNYLLQIRIQTWSWDGEKAKELQQRWAKYGYLWHYDVKSEPLHIRVEKPKTLKATCQ